MLIKSFTLGLFFQTTICFAFSVPNHISLTQMALRELKECQLLPAMLNGNDNGQTAMQIMTEANADEDNYLKNGIKKLFIYSHFYNPVRPLRGEFIRAHHADRGVLDYTTAIQNNFSNEQRTELSIENLKTLGQIIHLVQDVSSAPHVFWINHAMADGFENKVPVSDFELEQIKPNCADISLAGFSSPIEIMKSAGLATLKELNENVKYTEIRADGSEPIIHLAPWSKTFYSNDGVYTEKLLLFLKNYNYLSPDLNSPVTGDNNQEGWNLLKLPRGEYGPFSNDIKNVTIRGDHFGNTRVFSVGDKKYQVDANQYVQLKKTLMRQSILSTQRLILWLNNL